MSGHAGRGRRPAGCSAAPPAAGACSRGQGALGMGGEEGEWHPGRAAAACSTAAPRQPSPPSAPPGRCVPPGRHPAAPPAPRTPRPAPQQWKGRREAESCVISAARLRRQRKQQLGSWRPAPCLPRLAVPPPCAPAPPCSHLSLPSAQVIYEFLLAVQVCHLWRGGAAGVARGSSRDTRMGKSKGCPRRAVVLQGSSTRRPGARLCSRCAAPPPARHGTRHLLHPHTWLVRVPPVVLRHHFGVGGQRRRQPRVQLRVAAQKEPGGRCRQGAAWGRMHACGHLGMV